MASRTSILGTLLRGRFSPLFFFIPVILVTAYVHFVSRAVWQTRLSGQQPALRLSIHRDASRILLSSEEDGEPIEFAVADSLAGVQEFWLGLREKGSLAPSAAHWRECPRVSGTAGKTPQQGQELTLTQDSQGVVGSLRCEIYSEVDLTKEPVKESEYLPNPKTRSLALWVDVERNPSTYREVWLIPYVRSRVAQSWKVLHPVSALHWTEVAWLLGRDAQKQGRDTQERGEVLARECSSRNGPAQPRCLFAETLLDRPDLVLLRDPQQLAVTAAHWMELHAVPITVGIMVCTNLILLALLLAIALWWLVGTFASDKLPRLSGLAHKVFDEGVPADDEALKRKPGRIPLLIPLSSVDRGLRRLLEWLEVTGPALGFMLTVCALLLAFDPRTFVERDMNRFATAISMAMSATFAGLGIRLLAFTIDRLLEHVLRRGGSNFKVDLMDNVYTHSDTQPSAVVSPPPPAHLPVAHASTLAQPPAAASAPPVTHLPDPSASSPPPPAEPASTSVQGARS